jgi:hypothetical protein
LILAPALGENGVVSVVLAAKKFEQVLAFVAVHKPPVWRTKLPLVGAGTPPVHVPTVGTKEMSTADDVTFRALRRLVRPPAEEQA